MSSPEDSRRRTNSSGVPEVAGTWVPQKVAEVASIRSHVGSHFHLMMIGSTTAPRDGTRTSGARFGTEAYLDEKSDDQRASICAVIPGMTRHTVEDASIGRPSSAGTAEDVVDSVAC